MGGREGGWRLETQGKAAFSQGKSLDQAGTVGRQGVLGLGLQGNVGKEIPTGFSDL